VSGLGLLALAALLAPSAAQAPSPALDQKEAERQVAALALAVQKAARAEDAEAILALVHRDGVPCGNRLIPRDRFAADLRAAGTPVHDFFFGAGGDGHGRRTPPMSLEELLGQGKRIKVVVHFTEVEVAKFTWERPCVLFRVEGEPYAPKVCFTLRDGHWFLAELGMLC
jgi:hypothetical protein